MFPQTVSVLGCGWLGLPLGQFLLQKGFEVKGSTTQPSKIPSLRDLNITPYLLDFPLQSASYPQDFFDADVLFLNIPFKRQLPDPGVYRKQIESVMACVERSPLKRVIFASSTAVYPNTNGVVDEKTPVDLDNPRAVVLSGIEGMLLSNKKFRTCVVRFAGLFGPGRAFGSFFKKIPQQELTNTPVNLIHLKDCMGVVERILDQGMAGEILNACGDEHPLRKDLYSRFLPADVIKLVKFLEPKEHSYKIVSNQKLKRLLSYQFQYPDPMKAPVEL